jgi:hypothetical protein
MTKLKNRWLLWILPLAFFVSCKSNEGQWENKQISFPENIVLNLKEELLSIELADSEEESRIGKAAGAGFEPSITS